MVFSVGPLEGLGPSTEHSAVGDVAGLLVGTVQDFPRFSFPRENILLSGLNLADNTSTFYPLLH